MNHEDKPITARRGLATIESVLRFVNPAPDEETERFVAAIYADRRQARMDSRAE
ncbi:MAG TPA: hypothetical protein VGM43_07150 [Bryobacteraceae bacterium]|jgi:hypothetical protein